MHKDSANKRRHDRTAPEQKVRPIAALRQQNRSRQCDQEVRQPVTAVTERRGRSPSPLGMDLGGEDLHADGPGDGINHCEEVNEYDDHPARGAGGAVHGLSGVEAANHEHGDCEPDAAVDDAASAAPFVGVDQAWDCHRKDYQG